VTVPVTMLGGQGRLQVYWNFGRDRNTCATSGIASAQGVGEVDIYINGLPPVSRECRKDGIEGVAIDLDPGTYSVQVDGVIVVQDPVTQEYYRQVWYSTSFNANAVANSTRDIRVTMEPVAAGATFIPALKDPGGNATSCAAAGVHTLSVQLVDWHGNAGEKTFHECGQFEVAGFSWDWLLAEEKYDESALSWWGTWTAHLEGWEYVGQTPVLRHRGSRQVAVYAGIADQLFTVNLMPVP
jgi:hypothetical protein